VLLTLAVVGHLGNETLKDLLRFFSVQALVYFYFYFCFYWNETLKDLLGFFSAKALV
jgi:hypothetical protein